ncbi:MAG: SDR family oxidoreductase [Spirochaetales bacterium]|nr:SDR family oxidoreductase [Leptospiraceae bacterium]MCP5482154.1 SDR family oxidoreductase [Spirochaetales bacterium]MCP5484734.1 SDR family oxidoreductase [Spirochaetales bacterium]
MQDIFTVAGKSVFITGASRGIGKAIALAFQKAGARVTGLGSRPESVDWMADSGITPLVGDVADPDFMPGAIEQVIKHHGTIDCLINNAGVNANVPASSTKDETFQHLLDVNVRGLFRACQAYYKARRKEGGVIINVASIAGFIAAPLNTAYSATKGAVLQLTRSLAVEWAGSNFRVNAICPGIIDTDMSARVTGSEGNRAKAEAFIPMKRIGKPEELVGAALFLASEASSYMTGQLIVVDGGVSAQ